MSYNILAVIDGSGHSLNTIKSISQFVQSIPDVIIRLLYVYPVPMTSIRSKETKAAYQTMVATQSERALEASIEYLKSSGIPYEKKVVVGNLIQEINLNVQLYNCKLVVLNHEKNNHHDTIMDTVVNKVGCPILVVPD